MPGPFPYESFTSDRLPAWRCPACLNASLVLVPGSFTTRDTADSLRHRGEDWYTEEDDREVFCCMLECSRADCRESVSVAGTGRGMIDFDEQMRKTGWYTLYRAITFVPPLPLFRLPDACPEDVKNQLETIAALIPVSLNAAVNALRVTLELLLDELSVARLTDGDPPKRIPLAIRIRDSEATLGEHFAAFDALKDLGNHGSHTNGRIRRSHVEGACLILDELIQQLFALRPDHAKMVATLKATYGKK